jgi:hypothetical protein
MLEISLSENFMMFFIIAITVIFALYLTYKLMRKNY